VVEELSGIDGAAGWNLMIGASLGSLADYLPAETAEEIFGRGQKTVCAASFTSSGRADQGDGGYHVSGTWPFASGCQHADWLAGRCSVFEAGQPKLNDSGTPVRELLFLPATECQILDTWQSVGLKGSGSHDFRVESRFVPTARGFPFTDLTRGPSERPGLGYRTPFLGIDGARIAAVGLGIARDSLETFEDLAKTKSRTFGPQVSLASNASVQEKVGRAEMLLRAARAFLYETVRTSVSAAEAGRYNADLRALGRLAAGFAAEASASAVDIVYKLAGGTSVYTSSRLERCFRDVNTVTQHAVVQSGVIAAGGQHFLGITPPLP